MGDGEFGDVEVLRGMVDALDEDESRQLVVRDLPGSQGWTFGHSTENSDTDPGSNAWPFITDVDYDAFGNQYSDLLIDIARGEHDAVNELSDVEWPLFVEACERVEGWGVDVDELHEARGEVSVDE